MQYPNITEAEFVLRENRFVAQVKLQGEVIRVHVKNTGRCRELLVPGCPVWLTRSDNPRRKYAYDLIAVEKQGLLVNMDSQAPNQVFLEFLRSGGLVPGAREIHPEYVYGDSRLDFSFLEDGVRHLVEVKGVTLEQDGLCRFPDAPTLRGAKHLRELTAAVERGYVCWFCFVVTIAGCRQVSPNWDTDPDFARALLEAHRGGVRVRAFGCQVEPDRLSISESLPVNLEMQESYS